MQLMYNSSKYIYLLTYNSFTIHESTFWEKFAFIKEKQLERIYISESHKIQFSIWSVKMEAKILTSTQFSAKSEKRRKIIWNPKQRNHDNINNLVFFTKMHVTNITVSWWDRNLTVITACDILKKIRQFHVQFSSN